MNAFTERYHKWCKRHGYFFKQSNAVEVYELAKSVITLVPKGSVAKVLVQEAASQLTSISRSVETYRSEMNRLASMLPEYPVVMGLYGVGNLLVLSLWQKSATSAVLSASRRWLLLPG